jgi:hypothetical protein
MGMFDRLKSLFKKAPRPSQGGKGAGLLGTSKPTGTKGLPAAHSGGAVWPYLDEKARLLTGQHTADVLDGIYYPVRSSNVAAIQYYPDISELMVEFRSGAAYMYSDISRDEVVAFAAALSKGKFVWSYLRGRIPGEHIKPYKRIT